MSDDFDQRASHARADLAEAFADKAGEITGDTVRRRAARRRTARLALAASVLVLGASTAALTWPGSDNSTSVVADRPEQAITPPPDGQDPTASSTAAPTSATTPTSPSRATTLTPSTLVARCKPEQLRWKLATDRSAYAPGDEVRAVTTIQNQGQAPCRLPRLKGDEGCKPWVHVHFAFDPDGDGNFGPTNWLFGPYLSCEGTGDLVAPGASVTRTTTFRFGEGSSDSLPDGEWEVSADWADIYPLNTTFPLTHFRCVPGTCKPLDEYRSTTTTTIAPSSSTTTTSIDPSP